MKLVALVVLVFVVCALARPVIGSALPGHGRAAFGFATGVVAVPAFGIGGGAVGLVTGGPKGALRTGALGAHAGAELAQTVGGQRTKYY